MSSTVAEPKSPNAATPCPKCGSTEPWGMASWCPNCGYYPGLTEPAASKADADDPDAAAGADAIDPNLPLWKQIPEWIVMALGGALVILALSVAARLMFPEGAARVLWSLAQLLAGQGAMVVAHTAAYFFAIGKSDQYGPMDYFMKPREVWRPTFAGLPKTSRRVCLWVWGFMASFCAVAVIGGISKDQITEHLLTQWIENLGIREGADKNLTQAIVAQAREEQQGPDSLEGAMNEFVGDAQVPEEEEKKESLPDRTDCVVIGYVTDPDGSARTLVVAAAPRGRLMYAGLIEVESLPDDERRGVVARVESVPQREKSFVRNVPLSATWIEPQVVCRVAHDGWTSSGRLQKAAFAGLLRGAE